ncbi:MAG: alpha/beta fold hydrolase [Acidimicrobiales bacterium]
MTVDSLQPEAESAWPPAGWVEPKEELIDVGKLSLGALLYGDPLSDGPPIILVHGWADSAWSMDSVAQPLAADHRVISLDLRGHGRSDRGPYNILNFVGDLRSVIERLDLVDPILIGHSLGSHVTSQFCGLFPEVAMALVKVEGTGPPPRRLIDVDPDGVERAQSRSNVERTRASTEPRPIPNLEDAANRLRRAHALLDPARARFLAEKNTKPYTGEPTAEGQLEWCHDPDARDWLNGHSERIEAQRWRGIECPILVVNGSDSYDRYWRHIGDEPDAFPVGFTEASLADRLSDFKDLRYVEIAGAGHMLHYDKPEELNDAIAEFLAEVLSGQR